MIRRVCLIAWMLIAGTAPVQADTPEALYIYPAGGQRGTTVKFRVGGLYLHEACPFEIRGTGITGPDRIQAVNTVWFEGPVIPLPDSQQAEDYPRDLGGTLTIAADATPGLRPWRVWTDQGAVASRPFLVGELPEIVEDEVDGAPLPVEITLPVTINGRIFPREDVDLWNFPARAGQTITCAVVTHRLGSPFDARLEIRDSLGARLAESRDTTPAGLDAFVRFTAPGDGVYTVAIQDIRSGGLQHYVYRLTVTADGFVDTVYPLGGRRGTSVNFELSGANVPARSGDLALPATGDDRWPTTLGLPAPASRRLTLELGELPEALEREPNDQITQALAVTGPTIVNGRIDRPGDVDFWRIDGQKDQVWQLDLRAARLGSPLDGVLSLWDSQGKELARADDSVGTDPQLRWTVPADGSYFVKVEERLASRGSPAFGYRLIIAPPETPDFTLHLPAEALTLNRGSEIKFKVRAQRYGNLAEPITLTFENLPVGVTMSNHTIAGNANEVEVSLKADAGAPIVARHVQIRGAAQVAGQAVVRQAQYRSPARDDITADHVLLAVAQPTPFKVKGVFQVKYAQRGGKFVRHFSIDRNGFEGLLQVRLADRQMRHLQGVEGPTIEVPPGVSEFDYPVFLPPWMEIGRTSRTVVMASGEVVDPDGSRHKVSFTSQQQNEQIVALIDPGQLSIELEHQTLAATPGTVQDLPFRIGRGPGVHASVQVELIAARHIRGVTAERVQVPGDEQTGKLQIRFATGTPGPFNMPLVVRAVALKGPDDPVVAETKLEIVP